ncbi:MAG: glycerophosphodiester phosphodiesterase [Helicobacteraceae bacterium CG2_30_36_10]|nr:MAG: glycerophosphodiester phosphodiesterase [Helicobacteraceae bacterium CG2_30_36_10]
MNFLELLNRTGLIGAHRGARYIAPENTMRSLKVSVGFCDFIEIDVQLSSDGTLIVIHDDTLERTTNVAEIDEFKSRKPYKVSDFSFKELSSLDYGSWFDGHVEPLLTLSETLQFIKENALFLNIEIKDMHTFFSDGQVVSAVLKEIQDWQVQNKVLISSFRHEYLSLCKERLPDVPTAALVQEKHTENLLEYLKTLKVDACNMSNELADKENVSNMRKAGYGVNVYTVNEKTRAKELFEMGVNGIFTDNLDLFSNIKI